jgi:hypothetical protein
MPAPTIDRPISPLRQRLIDDMNMRRLRVCTARISLRARSRRPIVCVKKNRNAETMLFMVGVGTPASLHAERRNRFGGPRHPRPRAGSG